MKRSESGKVHTPAAAWLHPRMDVSQALVEKGPNLLGRWFRYQVDRLVRLGSPNASKLGKQRGKAYRQFQC